MANVKPALVRKLKKILTTRFPPPAKVRLEEIDGIIGVVTTDEFLTVDSFDRQILFRDLMKANLTQEERYQVQAIVGVTHDEETFHLASVD